MSEKTNIAWCDSTLNFWEGYTKVSAGCANCYAEARDRRFTGWLHWGKGVPRRKSKSAVKDALRLNRMPWICDRCGSAEVRTVANWNCCDDTGEPAKAKVCVCGSRDVHRRRIFSLSLGDWLDPEIPVEWLAEMLDTIRQCENVNWILCTKRPELWEERVGLAQMAAATASKFPLSDWLARWLNGNHPRNVCALASVENQEMADQRIPALLRIPARWHGLSCEPLLGPLDLTRVCWPDRDGGAKYEDALRDPISDYAKRSYPAARLLNVPRLQWLIIGGESGPKARPCNVEWIRSLVAQGKAAGVATFVKQLGAYPMGDWSVLHPNHDWSNVLDKKGGDPSEWPDDLRIQQWPEGL